MIEGHQLDAVHPCLLEGIYLGPGSTTSLCCRDLLAEREEIIPAFRLYTKHELMVARVNDGADELRAFRIGPGNEERLETHDVPLHARGDEARDVLAEGHENLACLVPALFTAVQLVLEMHGRCACLAEGLGELHDGGETAMAAISRRHGIASEACQLGYTRHPSAIALVPLTQCLRRR